MSGDENKSSKERNEIEGSVTDKDQITSLQQQIKQLNDELSTTKRLRDNAMQIIHNSPMVFWTLDNEGIFTLSEGGALDQLGLKPGQVVGMSVFDVYKDFPEIIESQKLTLAGEKTQFYYTLQGTQYLDDEIEVENTYFESKLVPLFNKDNQQTGLLGVAYDVSQLKRTEAKLSESEKRYKTLINEAPIAIMVLEGAYCKFANPASIKLFGFDSEDEMIDLLTTSLLAPSVREQLMTRTIDREAGLDVPQDYETSGLKRNGEEFPMFVYARSIILSHKKAVMLFFIDLTETKKLEKEKEDFHLQLLKSQKLESLGILAGGIAHDFNNILVGILGNASLAEAKIPKDSDAFQLITEIQNISEKAADLTKQMLAYTGKTQILRKLLNLNKIINEMGQLLKVSVSKSIVLKYDLDKNIGLFEGDESQIRQIILNIVINASEAIGEENGVITIITGHQIIDPIYSSTLSHPFDLMDGDYIYLEISDNGIGIPQNQINSIFDPFYSTKFTGRGLGLSVVQGIVTGHNGAIKVYSETDNGTSFKFLFPLSNKTQVLVEEEKIVNYELNKFGTVLFCDDDPTIRKTAKSMLNYLGYDVLLAANGEEGIELLEKNVDTIILVILDLTMPILSGREIYSKIRLITRDLPIIMSSGYNEVEVVENFRGKELTSFLQKPYSLNKLKQTIKDALS